MRDLIDRLRERDRVFAERGLSRPSSLRATALKTQDGVCAMGGCVRSVRANSVLDGRSLLCQRCAEMVSTVWRARVEEYLVRRTEVV